VVRRVGHHAGAHRVQHHVARQLQQVRLTLDHDGLVPPLKDMPHPAMAPVEGLRPHPVQMAHARRQVAVRRFQQQFLADMEAMITGESSAEEVRLRIIERAREADRQSGT
jgi:hypothetical protein